MMITRGLAVGVVLAGAAVGLAGPASAEPLSGSYTATVIEGGMTGFHKTLVATPCGANCTHLEGTAPVDLHVQGDSWTGTRPTRDPEVTCTVTVNSASLVETDECGSLGNTRWQLTKNG
jgi:hypothetical protein